MADLSDAAGVDGNHPGEEADRVPGPSWLAAGLAVILAATALYCATHFILAIRSLAIRLDRPAPHDGDIVHTVMGTVMAAALVGAVHLGSSPPWAATFAVMTLWFVWRSLHAYVLGGGCAPAIGYYARHGVLCAAMVVMVGGVVTAPANADSAPGRGPMSTMAGLPSSGAHTPVLLVGMLASVVCVGGWDAYRLGRTGPTSNATPPVLTTRFAIWCELAMSVAMGYMLLMMW